MHSLGVARVGETPQRFGFVGKGDKNGGKPGHLKEIADPAWTFKSLILPPMLDTVA